MDNGENALLQRGLVVMGHGFCYGIGADAGSKLHGLWSLVLEVHCFAALG